MKRLIMFLWLPALVLVACSAPGPAADSAGPTPTRRVVMTATDPETFVRASGQPQLVDFFAFW